MHFRYIYQPHSHMFVQPLKVFVEAPSTLDKLVSYPRPLLHSHSNIGVLIRKLTKQGVSSFV